MRTDGQRGDQAIEGDASGACQAARGKSLFGIWECPDRCQTLKRARQQNPAYTCDTVLRSVEISHGIRLAARQQGKDGADSAMERMAA